MLRRFPGMEAFVVTALALFGLIAHTASAAGGFTLYEHWHYLGRSYSAPAAAGGCQNLYPDNNFNDLATSVKFNWANEPHAASVRFFEHGDCVGDSWIGYKGSSDLPEFSSYWNDKWSSYIWTLNTGGFTLYEHEGYLGGKYTSPNPSSGCINLYNFNDLATSATFDFSFAPTATKVTFFEHGGCVGDSWFRAVGGGDEPAFNSYWTDKWSSFQWTLASTPTPTSSPPPPPSSTGCTQGLCPSGWCRAVGTIYDSWPKPGSRECGNFSGCGWAGLFARIYAGGGPVCDKYCCLASSTTPCNSPAQMLSGGSNTSICCRYPESVVASWSVAATFNNSQLLDKEVEVMVYNVPNKVVTVNIVDECADIDCTGCCSQNTNFGKFTLLDLEKHPASDLLSFDISSPTFDVSDVSDKPPLPSEGWEGAPPDGSVMPLCYKVIGPSQIP